MIHEKTLSAIELLKQLIQTPSFSKQESDTATIIDKWLNNQGVKTERSQNNIWAKNLHFDESKMTILLNSHHDTVKPNQAYSNDPFDAKEVADKLYGLGSNDAGGALVSLMSTFIHFYRRQDLNYNLVIAATAEEEISGQNGIASILDQLPIIDFAIVGEPTEMQLAIAEKGLMVIDAFAEGRSGHAAHDNTVNAIYQAMEDIRWLQQYEFPKTSKLLGNVKISVTQINAGTQHNVVPANCHFVIDVRVCDVYQNQEVFDIIDQGTDSKIKARSMRLNSSSIPANHPIVVAGLNLGSKTYGSPTISDQALLPFPSLKIGPGKSARSHSADEFIHISEIDNGIIFYIKLLEQIL